jgi:hypothetical protein
MMDTYKQQRAVRVLRNLRINEVSGVDKGAGRGVRIMLMKRDEPQETDMNTEAIAKIAVAKATNVWNGLVELTAKQQGISISKAIDQCLRTELGQQAFSLAKRCDGASFLKIGGGSLPQPEQGRPHASNYDPPLAPRSAVPGPIDYASQRPRRDQHAEPDADDRPAKAFKVFTDAVDQMCRDGMRRTDAFDEAVKRFPATWAEAKKYRIKPMGDVSLA